MFWEVDCNIKQNEAREGKNIQISTKIHQTNMQKCAKISPLSAKKHLFCLKTRSKSTFQSMKLCSKWVCLEAPWVDFECFKQFDEGLHDFWSVFGPFLTPFEPFLTLSGAIQGILGWFWTIFGSIRGHLWVNPGSFLYHFGVGLTPFWGLFGPF